MLTYNQPGVTWAFNIGSIEVSWYGILSTIGFVISFIYVYIQWHKHNYSKWDFNNLFFLGIIASLWGARLWYIIFNPVQAFQHVDGVLSFLNALIGIGAARSIMGSMFFMTLLFAVYPKLFHRQGISWKVSLDIMLPAMLLGQIVGRWGNFANHQVFGDVVSQQVINLFPSFIREGMLIKTPNGIIGYRSPLFLYESFANLISFVLIISIIKNNKFFKPGTQGAAVLICYGIIRSTMETLRNPLFQMNWNSFQTSFWLAIIFTIVGVILFVQCQYEFVSNSWSIIKRRRNNG